MANKPSPQQNPVKEALTNLMNAPVYTNPGAAFAAQRAALETIPSETPATKEQWQQLYEVAEHIYKAEPWEYLYDSERITMLLPGRDEPVYIIVMGAAEETYGIGIYPGYDAISRIEKLAESDSPTANLSFAFEQNCINLYFGNRDELEKRDHNIIKELGLKFRGKNRWPYFRSMKPGFFPWHLNYDDAALSIDALQNFYMAFVAYATNEELEIDFDGGQTLLRFFDAKSDMWYNTAIKMPPRPVVSPKLIVSDAALLDGIKKRKKTKDALGVIVTYLPTPIQEKEERPMVPRAIILVNMQNGMIINQETATIDGDFASVVLDVLINYIEANGRPSVIAVPDDNTAAYVEDFSAKIGVKLKYDERLIEVISDLLGHFSGGQDEMLDALLEEIPEDKLEEFLQVLPEEMRQEVLNRLQK